MLQATAPPPSYKETPLPPPHPAPLKEVNSQTQVGEMIEMVMHRTHSAACRDWSGAHSADVVGIRIAAAD